MRGMITSEDMDAWAWYNKINPIRLGQKESKLKRSLRTMGLDFTPSRPSDEKRLRMYREFKVREKLRGENSTYNKLPDSLKGIGGYLVDIFNRGEIKTSVDATERWDRVAEDVVLTQAYRR
jgi:hypothetical protein